MKKVCFELMKGELDMNSNKTIWLFHHNDMDGRVAAAITYRFLKTRYVDGVFNKEDIPVRTVELNYGSRVPANYADEIQENDLVIFVDYSFTSETVKTQLMPVVSKTKNIVTWIDHHDSSLKLLSDASWNVDGRVIPVIYNPESMSKWLNSGTALAYSYYFRRGSTPLPKEIKYVTGYDSWQRDTSSWEYGAKLNNAFRMQESIDPKNEVYQKFVDGCLREPLGLDYIDHLLEVGSVIMKYQDNQNKIISKSAYEVTFNGLNAVAINGVGNSNIFGDWYYAKDLCIAYVYDGRNSTYRYTLYSNSADVDCSVIAEQYGGGGHKGAAGFTSSTKLV